MKRLLSGRPGAALMVGGVAILAAGGGYAIAAGTSSTIKACANKQTGALRVSNHCTSKETALSWNKVGPAGPRGLPGPQGPGAKLLVYNAPAASATAVLKKIGTVGPWTIYGSCRLDTGTVSGGLEFTGPAVTEDSWGETETGPIHATTLPQPAGTIASPNALGYAYSNGGGSPPVGFTGLTATFISKSGRYLQNVVVTATSQGNGDSSNACHASDAVTPLG